MFLALLEVHGYKLHAPLAMANLGGVKAMGIVSLALQGSATIAEWES